MTYTTSSGTPVPEGPDAFNPNVQLKALADAEATFNWSMSVANAAARNAIATPQLRNGLIVTQQDDGSVWERVSGAWVCKVPTIHASGGAITGSGYGSTGPFIIKAASAVVTPDASSVAVIGWNGGAFPNGLLSVVATPGDAGTSGKSIQVSMSTTLSNLYCVILNSAGAGVGAVAQRVNYVAVGW